jgi:type IV pilus assembly protein PilB
MGIENYLIASTLSLIIAQRLARRLCQECKQAKTVTKADMDEIGKYRPDLVKVIKVGSKIYEAPGCKACNGVGTKGRIGFYELLEVTKEIRNGIVAGTSTDDLLDLCRKEGLVLLIEDGLDKLREGLVSLEELAKVTVIRE